MMDYIDRQAGDDLKVRSRGDCAQVN